MFICIIFFLGLHLAAQDQSAAFNYVIQEELTTQNKAVKRKRGDSTSVGISGTQRLYPCNWCEKVDHAGNVNRHMHNSCKSRPAQWKCENCPIGKQGVFKTKTFNEILAHNTLNHGHINYWTCPACIKPIQQAMFIKHFCTMTNAGNIKKVFKGFKTDTDYKINHKQHLSDFIDIISSQEDSPSEDIQKKNDQNELYKISIAHMTHPTDEFIY